MLFEKRQGKEVRNYKSTASNGKTIIDITSEPRQIQSRLGWLDIDTEYADVKDITDVLEEKLTSTQRSRRRERNDLQSNFYAHRMHGRVILDAETAIADTFGIKSHIEDKLVLGNKKHLPREFIWLEGAEATSGVIELPYDDYSHVYVASGDYNNPDITFINEGKDGDKRPYYQKRDGKTYIYVDHFSGGGGTQADPYLVSSYDDLCKVGTGTDGWNLSSYYKQTTDIQCPIGAEQHNFVPIGDSTNTFTGQYDGDNYKIKNLYISLSTTNNVGLFGYCGAAVLKNIHLTDANVTGSTNCGALVGLIDVSGGTVFNCSSSGTVYAKTKAAGGLIGVAANGIKITNCCSSATAIATQNHAGGLIGRTSTNVELLRCFATGKATATTLGTAGGLIGYSYSSFITNCFATGNTKGFNYCGGLIGTTNSETVSYCYSTGSMETLKTKGGLISSNEYTVTVYSYWDTQTSGTTSSVGGTGKTTVEMKTQSTYTDWDFTDIWGIDSAKNNGYPYLRVFDVAEEPEGTLETLTIDLCRSVVCTETNATDTSRQLAVVESINADTLRQIAQGVLEQTSIDTLRKVIAGESLLVDTLRKSAVSESFTGDTARRVALTEAVYADTSRQVTVQDVQQINIDTLRVIVKSEVIASDTKRGAAVAKHIFADTLRVVVLQEVQMINADTLRVLVREETSTGDTTRRTLANETTTADLTRRTGTSETTTFGAIRNIVVEEATLLDTLRQTLKRELLSIDTKRRTVKVEVVNADTLRRINQGDSVIVSIVELLAEWDVEVELLAEWDVEKGLEAEWDVEVELEADIMGKENQDFEIKTGCTKILKFTAILPEGKTLQGATLQWGLYNRKGKEALVKDVGNGIAITGDNTFEVTLTHTETATFAIEPHYHEAKLTDALGQKSTVAEGTVTVEKGYLN